MSNKFAFVALIVLLVVRASSADAQNKAKKPDSPAIAAGTANRKLPPPGISIPSKEKGEFERSLKLLKGKIDAIPKAQESRRPDADIFHKAVHDAVQYAEFFDAREFVAARDQLKIGLERAMALAKGEAPWEKETGLVVRAYRSRIDDSVQPYGLVIPANFNHASKSGYRLDVWLHGRSDKLSEVSFLQQRMKSAGELTLPDAIVLHPYGRFCNAFKFAGEVDVFEAIEHVCQNYPIDRNRISIRGFSMGGAGCWHLSVHYPSFWMGSNPGAGFVDTAVYLDLMRTPDKLPPWFEQKLWQAYDCPPLVINLAQLNLVAYSGEKDKQKQAADLMAAAMKKEGMTMDHVIGPNVEHKIHPDSKPEMERRFSEWLKLGKTPAIKHAIPSESGGDWVRWKAFATPTLRYHQQHGLTIDGLNRHWELGKVMIDRSPSLASVRVETENITGFSLETNDLRDLRRIEIDGKSIAMPALGVANNPVHFRKESAGWTVGELPGLRKRHGLSGPIDDAFFERFAFVKPTGKYRSKDVEHWATSEMARAISWWRQMMRGDVIIFRDQDVTQKVMEEYHLVLWGDPSSNSVFKKLADQLPIVWRGDQIVVGEKFYDARHHALIAIAPNPLHRQKYVVLNSGLTFREGHVSTNSKQTPKLPDWAVIDLRTPPDDLAPGKIVDADFFGDHWEFVRSSR